MKLQFKTPILLLTFNRPDTTQLVFNQIREMRPKYLYVACDGPRVDVEGEREKCEEVRSIILQVDWDCEVQTLFQKENLRSGKAVSTALSWFFSNVEEGIILEDDCLPDLSFFPYCEELIIKYRNSEQVMLISGSNFQNGILRGEGSYFFTNYANMWGWASWKRVWQYFEFRMPDLNVCFKNQELDHVFQSGQEKRYWFKKFLNVQNFVADIWDYQLLYAIWKNKGLTINPNVNMIKNLGLQNNPTHQFLHDSYVMPEMGEISFPLKHTKMIVDRNADKYTFNNIYSYSIKRVVRLIMENGLSIITRKIFNKWFN